MRKGFLGITADHKCENHPLPALEAMKSNCRTHLLRRLQEVVGGPYCLVQEVVLNDLWGHVQVFDFQWKDGMNTGTRARRVVFQKRTWTTDILKHDFTGCRAKRHQSFPPKLPCQEKGRTHGIFLSPESLHVKDQTHSRPMFLNSLTTIFFLEQTQKKPPHFHA